MALFVDTYFKSYYHFRMNIKELRKSKGLSQEEVSKLIGVPLRSYKRYENKKQKIDSIKYNFIIDSITKLPSCLREKHHSNKKIKIAIVGIGYVGLSLACLLSQKNPVVITDIIEEKIAKINDKISPINDGQIINFLENNKLLLKAQYSQSGVYEKMNIIIIAVSTNINATSNDLNTENVESILDMIYQVNKKALVVIKSTVPIGFTRKMNQKYQEMEIIFSPEFLREEHSIHDNMYPSRIIVGTDRMSSKCKAFASLIEEIALNSVQTIFMPSTEAEAVKLFSNTYLAMRVAFFNELDSYAKTKHLSTKKIINGVSLDPRIGDYYNNPSFGYGGYCLPKDTAQLSKTCSSTVNNDLITAISKSNLTRKEYIVQSIIENARSIIGNSKQSITVGVYLLSMKKGSGNYRSSSTLDIIKLLNEKGIKTVVYDPNYPAGEKDLPHFFAECDYFVANRYDENLYSIKSKLFTCDIFNRD